MKFITKKDVQLPKRKRSARKGDAGRVLIVGGSEDYVGAPALAGIAALRAGCDWVTIAAPEKVGWAINCMSPDLVVKKLPGKAFSNKHLKTILALEQKHDVVLIGNGMGLKAKKFMQTLIKKIKKPMVLDADAIKVVKLQDIQNSILTPHLAEFHQLLENSNLQYMDFKPELKTNIIALKGRIDKIMTKTKKFYNKTGNAGMAKAGTGDVLAGIIASFLAQTNDPVLAAKAGVYYNGLAGDILAKKRNGFTYLASDLATAIKNVII